VLDLIDDNKVTLINADALGLARAVNPTKIGMHTFMFWNLYKFHVAVGVIVDQPYGLGQEAWDKAWTEQELKTLLRQIDATAQGNKFWIAMYCNHMLITPTVKELTDHGYQNVSVFVWWKHNLNIESVMHVIFATEYIVMGWRSGVADMPSNLDKNPTKRHNVFIGPQKRVFHRDGTGNIINPYQKPAYLAYNMCKAFAEPYNTVLIVGSGAGGDVEGCVAARMNVIALENDERQFRVCFGDGGSTRLLP
jgi:hypothetical protein